MIRKKERKDIKLKGYIPQIRGRKMRLLVSMTDGKNSYTEEVFEDILTYYCEIVGNGANEYMCNVSFKHFTREIEIDVNDLKKFNVRDEDAHFIFGWVESFDQSDDVPSWIRNSPNITVSVIQEF